VFEARDLELCSRLTSGMRCTATSRSTGWPHKTQVPHRVFLKMNSGMNRLGFTPERFRAAWRA
jgi:alanine racemase